MAAFKKTYTFDDVLLVPAYSEILPSQTNVQTTLSKRFALKIPIMSASMDTVTEANMAYHLAMLGGIGVIHKNMSITQQANMVAYLKKISNGICWSVMAFDLDTPIKTLQKQVFDNYLDECVFVFDKNNHVVNFITKEQLANSDYPANQTLAALPKKSLPFVQNNFDPHSLWKALNEHQTDYLALINETNRIVGVVQRKWLEPFLMAKEPLLDEQYRVKVLASVSAQDKDLMRTQALIQAGVDGLVVDSAHGHSKNVLEVVAAIKKQFPDVFLIAGNVVTPAAVDALAKAGADAIKVGIGSGSICTTRLVSGVGFPQLSAILDTVAAAQVHNLSVIADGGIKNPGDITKALAAGADAVMLGSVLAGCEQACGQKILVDGKYYKTYRGMGSLAAMPKGSHDRYGYAANHKFVPEGISAMVPYKGLLEDIIHQMVGGLKSGMGYLGAIDIPTLQKTAQFITQTNAAYLEGKPHSVIATEENSASKPNSN